MSSTNSSLRDSGDKKTKVSFPNLGKIFFSHMGLLLLTIPGLILLIILAGRVVRVHELSWGDKISVLHKGDVLYLGQGTEITMTLRSPKHFELTLADGSTMKSQGPRYDMLFGADLQLDRLKVEGFRISEASDKIYVENLRTRGDFRLMSSVGFPAIYNNDVEFISLLIGAILAISWLFLLIIGLE